MNQVDEPPVVVTLKRARGSKSVPRAAEVAPAAKLIPSGAFVDGERLAAGFEVCFLRAQGRSTLE